MKMQGSHKNTDEMRKGNTYITAHHFHLSGMAHLWSFRLWSEMSSFLSSQICVQVLWRNKENMIILSEKTRIHVKQLIK